LGLRFLNTLRGGGGSEAGSADYNVETGASTSISICFPRKSCPSNKDCGIVSNECGGTLSCGTCDGSENCVSNVCQEPVCGDGFIYAGVEQCDDGDQNGKPNSECSQDCKIWTDCKLDPDNSNRVIMTTSDGDVAIANSCSAGDLRAKKCALNSPVRYFDFPLECPVIGTCVETEDSALCQDPNADDDEDGVIDSADLCPDSGAPENVHTTGDNAGCLLGDANHDGNIGVADITAILGAWGGTGGTADVSGDGTVGVADITFVLGKWTG